MFDQTRGHIHPKIVDFEEAILNPSADFGGLYTLKTLPHISHNERKELSLLSYIEFSKKIFSILKINIDENMLHEALSTYHHFDFPDDPAPLKKIHEDLYVQELYHGPTRAFKDMALQPFGSILSHLAKQRQEKYLILVATSGDTGPATLHALKGQENIFVTCLYPSGGTSDIQRLQMTTVTEKNLKVMGIQGDFDDAQSALKKLLADSNFRQKLSEKNILLSAANSVNFGRIVFQIIYHAYASLRFENGVDMIIPSGNFGNALGAFYAKLMGFNIDKIIIASNQNNILTEWIQTGIYNIQHRRLHKTQSPAMDILKSSNVERVLYALFGTARTKELLESLEQQSFYALSQEELRTLQTHFEAFECSDDEGQSYISTYAKQGYLIDPHTATGMKAYAHYKQSDRVKILASTAEYSKFATTVAMALGLKHSNDKEALQAISENMNIALHQNITALFEKAPTQNQTVSTSQIAEEILGWLAKEIK